MEPQEMFKRLAIKSASDYTGNPENGKWVPDPELPGVFGFRSHTGQIMVVLYAEEEDFETADNFPV